MCSGFSSVEIAAHCATLLVRLCPSCRSTKVDLRAVSGQGTVLAVTVNHHSWHPDFEPPYLIAIVAIDEIWRIRLTTQIIRSSPGDVAIGSRGTCGLPAARGCVVAAVRAGTGRTSYATSAEPNPAKCATTGSGYKSRRRCHERRRLISDRPSAHASIQPSDSRAAP